MSNRDFNFKYAVAVTIAVPVIMFLSWSSLPITGPEEWVTEWTDWAVTYVGLAVAARGLWVVSDGAAAWLRSRAGTDGSK